jgi:uncharacterized protein
MNFLKQAALFILLATLLAGAPLAQTGDSHREAAKLLLNTVDFEKNMLETIDNMLEMQIRQNPDLIAFKDVMSDFFIRHLTSEDVKERYIDIYVDSFTEEEINELNSFFQTDLGRKYYQESQILSMKGMQIGEEAVQNNMAEFQTLMMQRAQELEGLMNDQ